MTPQRKPEFPIKAECSTCHGNVKSEFTGSQVQMVGITCTDCKMLMAIKLVTSPGPNRGGVKALLFRINTDPTASVFTEQGTGILLKFSELRDFWWIR